MKFPVFIENSKVPAFLSFFSPINIGAITLGPFVFSRGEISDRTKNHEAIHWAQYKETLIVGFLLAYVFYWLVGLLKYQDGSIAYYRIPFEQEAYDNDDDFEYLEKRPYFSWFSYKV